jgi:predicted cobalt transporter CbtA
MLYANSIGVSPEDGESFAAVSTGENVMLRKGYALLLATTLAVAPLVGAMAQAGAAGGAAGGGAGAGAGAGGGVPEGQVKTGAAETSKTNHDAANTDNSGNVMPKPMAKSGASNMDKQ